MVSDCKKCWETPCICGWDYVQYTTKYLDGLLLAIIKAKLFKRKYSITKKDLLYPQAEKLWDKFSVE